MREFEKRVVVVTGSSRGIGQAIAVAFAAGGATVVGAARSTQEDTAQLCRDAGGTFEGRPFDASGANAASVAAWVDQVLVTHGRIDVLINNAGTIRRAPAAEYPEADWNEVIHTNLTAPFLLAQAVGRWWIDAGRSKAEEADRLKIVNIASLLSFQGGVFVPAYTAAKHGLAGVTRALANEWARERVNVNAVAPGYIATENTRALREDATRNKAILDRIPEGRWGRAEDIAGTCVFLASRSADYLNGAILNVDGGWLGR
jgi:2-deoxy-D-gluconate 3-dehydrogenase